MLQQLGTLQTHATDTFLFISYTKNVLLFKFRCNIFIGVRIIKEMPGSVASGTHCIKIFTIEYTLPIKPKNHSSLDICLYEVPPCFGVRNFSLKACSALLMHTLYSDGQHKRTTKEQQTVKYQTARKPDKQQHTTPVDCRGVKKLS